MRYLTRKAFTLVELLAILLSVWGGVFSSAAELYVSPTGNDANPGTQEKPLATIGAARNAARAITGESVTVNLGGGTYYLSEPVVFTAADARTVATPLVFKAMPGQSPIISGGRQLALAWRPFRGGIMRADTPAGLTFDQLFVDGQRQHMARWPDYDATAQYFQGFSGESTSAQRVAGWENPAGGFVHAMHRSLWGDMHWKIAGKKDNGDLDLAGGWQNNRQMGAHKQFRFVENIFEELDSPGEWFLDSQQNVLYFCPPEEVDLNTAKIEAVRLKHLVEFRGNPEHPAQHITLDGLTFTHTARTFMENKEPLLRSDWTTYRGGAILFDGAEDCAVRDCFIDQVGGNGIFVNQYNRRIQITGCHIANAGASAVSFVGDPDALRSPLFEYHETQTLEAMDRTPGPKTTNYPADCLVEDCLIYLNGRVEKQTAGVNICMAESITVRHCSIYDCPRAGINICDGAFGGHLIEFCDVFDTVKETGDHGSFNSWGRDRFWHPDRGQTADWVEKHPDMPKWDCHKTIVLRNNRWRCDHGWDIDLDDGSSNYELYNNLCLAGGIKLREGYDRNVYNNIMVNYTFCPHVWYPNCRTSFKHNIVWQDGYAPAGMRETDQGTTIDDNFVHQPGAAPRSAEELPKFGGDARTIIADAMFLDPLAGDYRVKEDSPALQQGFKNFAMDRFGVQKPELRTIARTPPLPGTLEAAQIASGGWGRRYQSPKTAQWLGAKLKGIDNDGEMSAVGLGDRKGVLIVKVADGSESEKAGLRENDVIRTVNDQTVSGLKNFADIWKKQIKQGPATMTVWRDQAELTVLVPTRKAADRGKAAVKRSPHARLRPATMDEAAWTEGFWADRFHRSRTATIPAVEEGLLRPDNSEQLEVLLIAAGLKDGDRKGKGTNWTDGDCYKWIEAMARQYTVSGDPALARKMDEWIEVIARAQSPDGYLSTNFWNNREGRLQMPYFHEMYNMGHLLTAGSVHFRATGKTTLLDIAKKNANFLHGQFSPRPPRLVHFPWNPSAHMGLVDLYRTSGEKKYLELARTLIDNRGSSPGGGTHQNGGTDQTQDRTPLREETEAVGHAVCATYFYCGATDLYAETGETALLDALERIWESVTTKRMFITGGVGTGSGKSTRGDPVHEAFLDDYQLPNDCYCETCSNIGNAMWNLRLTNVTGDAKFADVMEQVLYNSGLSPVNIEQDRFFYCNPLEWNADRKPTHNHRTPSRWLVHSCYCCPPQMARTLSSLQTWAYSVGEEGIWVNLYSGSKIDTKLSGGPVRLTLSTEYPWSGRVRVQIEACPSEPFSLMLRIPAWCENATITINNKPRSTAPNGGTYAELKRVWKTDDVIELNMPMPVRLMESHPNVAGNRNRIAVMRGPIVYCLELPLNDAGKKIWKNGIYFPENIDFTPRYEQHLLGGVVVLDAKALTTDGKKRFIHDVVANAEPAEDNRDWQGVLYRPFHGRKLVEPEGGLVPVTLIPYYAWANRGDAYMQVWTPLAR